MDNPGAVSVWLGNCSSEELVREYLDIKYDEHGDRIPSKFMVDFKINFIDLDEDLIEYSYKNSPISSLRQLLKDASDSERMINEFEEFYGAELTEEYNISIRIYDFEYEEIVDETIFDGRILRYIGSVICEE